VTESGTGALAVLVAAQLSVLGLSLTFLSQNLRLKSRLDRLERGCQKRQRLRHPTFRRIFGTAE